MANTTEEVIELNYSQPKRFKDGDRVKINDNGGVYYGFEGTIFASGTGWSTVYLPTLNQFDDFNHAWLDKQ